MLILFCAHVNIIFRFPFNKFALFSALSAAVLVLLCSCLCFLLFWFFNCDIWVLLSIPCDRWAFRVEATNHFNEHIIFHGYLFSADMQEAEQASCPEQMNDKSFYFSFFFLFFLGREELFVRQILWFECLAK